MATLELPGNPADRVTWVISAPNQEEMRRRYDLWASQYDDDLGTTDSYLAPSVTADIAARFVAKDARVLDAGAGTGLSGMALKAAGFTNITATDHADGMLEIARSKGVYRDLIQGDLGAGTSFPDDSFDALVSVGTSSQIPAASLREFVRLVRPGGRIVFTVWVQAYNDRGFADIQNELETQERLALIHQGEAFQGLPTTEPEIHYEVWVFDVLS